jgi:hypothetical protein
MILGGTFAGTTGFICPSAKARESAVDFMTRSLDLITQHQSAQLAAMGSIATGAAAVCVAAALYRMVSWLLHKLHERAQRFAVNARWLYLLPLPAPASHTWGLSRATAAVQRPFKATHVIYLCVFIFGVLTSATALAGFVSKHVLYDRLFVVPLGAFVVINCVQQYLVYRDLLESENAGSVFFIRYQWWMGTPPEKAIRSLVMLCLLVLAGEIPYRRLPFVDALPGILRDPSSIVAIANCFLYGLLVIWNLAAILLIDNQRHIPGEERDAARKELKQAMLSYGLAFWMWSCVVCALLGAEGAGMGVTMLTAVYAINVLWFQSRVRGADLRRERIYRVWLLLATCAILVAFHLSDLDAVVLSAMPAAVQGMMSVDVQ